MATKSVSLSGVSLLALGLSFCPGQAASCSTNNGNLLSQTISHAQIGTSGQPDYEAAFSQTQLYTTYDEVNRLVSFSEGSGVRRGYGYDRYGNHWVDVDPAKSAGLPLSPLTPSGTAATGPNWYSGGNNRMTGVGYDAAGNQTQLSPFTLGYDAEGKQSNAVSASNGSAAYEYDGEGRRVRKWLCPNGGACSALTVGAQKTQYVYDAFGQLAAEYGGTVSGAGVSYVSTDHLGSTRLRTNGQGGVEARYDYLPFGEQMGAGVNGRSAKHASGVYPAPSDGRSVLFTGKERDAETGLDYFGARYMSAAQGRFTSADEPLVDQNAENPQSWNLYAYARSNPLKNRDLDGRICIFGIGNTCDDKVPPPPPPPAPRPPQGAPGTPTFPLTQAQDAARTNPNNQPESTGERRTFCNFAVCQTANALGGPSGPLRTTVNVNGRPITRNATANEMGANLPNSTDYREVSAAEAQVLANEGKLVIAAQPAQGHGHVTTVRPTNTYFEQGVERRGEGTLQNNVGRLVGIMQESATFRRTPTPRYYTPVERK